MPSVKWLESWLVNLNMNENDIICTYVDFRGSGQNQYQTNEFQTQIIFSRIEYQGHKSRFRVAQTITRTNLEPKLNIGESGTRQEWDETRIQFHNVDQKIILSIILWELQQFILKNNHTNLFSSIKNQKKTCQRSDLHKFVVN